jgi:multicomponent Na+:H+ antiporter subunit F
VTMWLVAALGLLVGVVLCGVAAIRGETPDALVAMVSAGVVVTLILILLAVGFGRSIYGDVAVVLGVLSFAGGLVFVQFLERWG